MGGQSPFQGPQRIRILSPRRAIAGLLFGLLVLGCGRGSKSEIPPLIRPDDANPGMFGSWTQVPPSNPPLNLILITLDTTRRDHLSCYGWKQATTPRMDQVAAEGILFTNAITPAPLTLPAHSSIMTGCYPYQHGVRNNGTYVLDGRLPTLAATLKAKGYDTGAIVASFSVAGRFGLGRGFDSYDDAFTANGPRRFNDMARRPAGDVTRLGLSWVDRHQGRPFFLWLHYFDAHSQYDPPEPYASRFSGDAYTGCIAYVDACVGDLVDGLKSRGLLDRTALLIVGDHGESLGEHQEMTHSMFIYQATQEIPFILRLPNAGFFADPIWRGHRQDALVSLIDCFPSALNLLGFPRSDLAPCAGLSVLPIVQGVASGHPWIYLETLVPRLEYAWSDLRGLETTRWKYIQAPKPELYDLVKDPKELHNLLSKDPAQVKAMSADLATVLSLDVGDEKGQTPLDQEAIEKLRSLGYLGGARPGNVSGPLADPKDMIRSYERVNNAQVFLAAHRGAEALARVDSVLRETPDATFAHKVRAACLLQMGRGDDAIPEYDRLIANSRPGPERTELERYRISAALTAGKLDDALDRVQKLIADQPKEMGLHLMLGRVLMAQKKYADSRRAIEDEARLFPEDAGAQSALGDLDLALGHPQAGEADYRAALKLNPFDAGAMTTLAGILITENRPDSARAYVEKALTLDPAQPEALMRQAWFYELDGRRDDAEACYQKVLALQPDNSVVLFNLGSIYLKTGRLDLAEGLLQRAARSGQASQELLINLGILMARKGRLADAIDEWNRAIELNPASQAVSGIRQNIERARAMMNHG